MNKGEIEDTAQKIVGLAEGAGANADDDAQTPLSSHVPGARDNGQAVLGQIKEQVGEAAAKAAEYAHDVYDHRQQHFDRGQRAIAQQFNQNPLVTVAIAAAAGLFLGFLIGRESR